MNIPESPLAAEVDAASSIYASACVDAGHAERAARAAEAAAAAAPSDHVARRYAADVRRTASRAWLLTRLLQRGLEDLAAEAAIRAGSGR